MSKKDWSDRSFVLTGLIGFVFLFSYDRLGGSPALCLADELPYSLRTHAFSGYQTEQRGDIRTVGMAGATLGLADTFMAAIENPAGLAMTLDIGDDNYTSTSIKDAQIQSFGAPLVTSSAGLALNLYPWGFGFGYVSPYQEGQVYGLPPLGGSPADLEVTIKELRFLAARVFLDNRLALGLSLRAGQSGMSENFAVNGNDKGETLTSQSYAVGFVLGASYQMPHRLLLGVSLSSAMHYAGRMAESEGIQNLFQDVDVPWTGGWV